MLLVSLWFKTLILYANVFTHKLQTSKIGTYAKGLSSGEVISAFVVGYMFYRALLVVYYIYFHPLSKFSGPKVAAVSGLYVFWYEVRAKKPLATTSRRVFDGFQYLLSNVTAFPFRL